MTMNVGFWVLKWEVGLPPVFSDIKYLTAVRVPLCKPAAPSSLSVGSSPHIRGDAGDLPFPHCQKHCRDAGKLDQLASGAGNIIFRAKEVREDPCPKNWADFF